MAAQQDVVRISQFLERTPLFAGIEETARLKIANATVVQEYPRGTVIIKQGSEGNALFLIARGRVTVLVEHADLGLEQAVAELGALEAFGEMSLLLQEPRTATVRAEQDTMCVILSAEAFQRIVMALPQVGLTVSRNLARRLQEQNRNAGFRFVRLADQPFDPELYGMLPASVLERHQMVPLTMDGDTLVVAMTRPNDPAALDAVRAAAGGLKLRPVACAEDDYLRYLRDVVRPAFGGRSDRAQTGSLKSGFKAGDLTFVEQDNSRLRGGEVAGESVVTLVNEILVDAINRGASDIHIEPKMRAVGVRLRVDGRLLPYRDDLAQRFHAPLVSRIKITAGMDISERRRPQDGRVSVRVKDRVFDLRVSTMPSLHGEKVVMRLLDPQTGVVPLGNLILSEPLAAVVRRAVFKPTGGILVVGPTGSGKTTTLYSALNERKSTSNDINIVTVEDPIEYTLEGVTQTQVSDVPGMGFASMLRALLRQDPDVMMIGEMRDAETAQIAMEASLTGHLVLSTLHADGAVEATTRLIEMGCPSYLVASAIDLVVSQRLLRRVCASCRTTHQFSEIVRRNLDSAGILPLAESESLSKGGGCDACHGTGYQGRVAAYEILRLSDAVREGIGLGEVESSLRRLAQENASITTFKQYCAFLLRQGVTTPSEVLRLFGAD